MQPFGTAVYTPLEKNITVVKYLDPKSRKYQDNNEIIETWMASETVVWESKICTKT